jgi:hypothetical protein
MGKVGISTEMLEPDDGSMKITARLEVDRTTMTRMPPALLGVVARRTPDNTKRHPSLNLHFSVIQ